MIEPDRRDANAGVDVAAILAHPRTGGLRVVGLIGEEPGGGPDPALPAESVTWSAVHLAAELAGLADDGDGALAVLTGPPPPTPWEQDALVRRVRDRAYRVLAMPGAERLGHGTRYLARRIGLLILDTDDAMALTRACWELIEGREALTLGYVRRIAQSIQYPAANLADLLQHLAAGIGHGVALVDTEGVLLEAGGHLPQTVHAALEGDRWSHAVALREGCAAAVRVDSPSRSGLRLVIFGTGFNQLQLNVLVVAAEVAMPSVAARILIDEVADVNDAAVASGLLREFLEHRDAPDPDIEQRMGERGWRTSGYHLGFRVMGRGRVNALQLLRIVAGLLGDVAADSHVATSGRGVTGWLSFAHRPPAGAVEEMIAALYRLHTDVRRTFNVATGVGTLESGATGLKLTIDGSTDAARIAANRSAAGYFLRIDTLGLEQLMLSWTESDTFVPAAASLLAPLMTHAPELLSTLTAYLDHESAVAATADALRLHRNTVAARISRAQELLGLDLSDPEIRLAVHLACRALR